MIGDENARNSFCFVEHSNVSRAESGQVAYEPPDIYADDIGKCHVDTAESTRIVKLGHHMTGTTATMATITIAIAATAKQSKSTQQWPSHTSWDV